MLLVCTGNLCRSALAERLGRAFLDAALGARSGDVRLVSAGTRAVVGSEMHPDSALVLQGLGAEAGDFRARQLAAGIADDADLVLTMTRRHRSVVLEYAPRALTRTFTLREAADLLRLVGEHVGADGLGFSERARDLVRQLAAARSRRPGGPDDDVRDPIGEPIDVHQEVGEVIVAALLPLLDRLVSLHRMGSERHVGSTGSEPGQGSGASSSS